MLRFSDLLHTPTRTYATHTLPRTDDVAMRCVRVGLLHRACLCCKPMCAEVS